MTRALLLLALIGLMQANAASADDKTSAGKDSLEGTWKLTSVEINAQPLSMDSLQEARLTVVGEKYSLVLNNIRLEMTHALSSDKEPKAMDLTIAEGEGKGNVYYAIYKLEGDTLTVCRNIAPGKDRPVEFASKPNTGLMLVVWKRQK